MFDPIAEPPISSAQVCRLPWLKQLRRRGGGSLQNSTVIRWMLDGTTINGRTVRLEHLRIGRTLCTSEAALKRFFNSLSLPVSAVASPPSATAGDVAKQHQRAEAELAAAGI
jgi:hypothetical protein